MTQTINIKKDLLVSLIIGEAAAWLLLALSRQVLPAEKYAALSGFFGLLPIIFPIICAVCLFIAFLLSKKAAILYQVAKFVLVGGANTLFDWGVLALLTFLFVLYFKKTAKDILLVLPAFTILYYSLYKSISFILAAVNSYLLNKFWTFKKEASAKPTKEFLRFFLVTFIGFLINVAIASGIFKSIQPVGGLNSDQWGILAAVIATAISMFWNFAGYKFIVFKY